MKLEWHAAPAGFRLGGVKHAELAIINLDLLPRYLGSLWEEIARLFEAYPDETTGTDLNVIVGAWPDTGELIVEVNPPRELARLALHIPLLEVKYFELSDLSDEEFEKGHDEMLAPILSALSSSLEDASLQSGSIGKMHKTAIFYREYDDKETSVPIGHLGSE